MDRLDFWLADTPIVTGPLHQRLSHERAGAFAGFEGWVRNHSAGRPVLGLRYEAYSALAHAEGARVLAEARARFDICDVLCVHRIGDLAIGDLAVWVGVSAAHRGAAFDACRHVIDQIKGRVPIWKHERYADGDADWLHPAPAGAEPAR